jgi:hypothetical protein
MKAIRVNVDNIGAVFLLEYRNLSERTKHIGKREKVELGVTEIKFVK